MSHPVQPDMAPPTSPPLPLPSPRPRMSGNRGWWIAFASVAVTFALFSTGVGQFLVDMREPRNLGHHRVGEWVDLSEYGFNIRVDALEHHDALPLEWDPEQLQSAPVGMKYLRVALTVEVRVPPGEDFGCAIDLYNGDGEHLALTEIGLGGVGGTGCSPTEREGLEVGDTFSSQAVFIVQEVPVADYEVQIDPVYTEEPSFCTVSY